MILHLTKKRKHDATPHVRFQSVSPAKYKSRGQQRSKSAKVIDWMGHEILSQEIKAVSNLSVCLSMFSNATIKLWLWLSLRIMTSAGHLSALQLHTYKRHMVGPQDLSSLNKTSAVRAATLLLHKHLYSTQQKGCCPTSQQGVASCVWAGKRGPPCGNSR